MQNFDFKNLILVNPCELTDECYARAMHAQDILKKATITKTFEEAINTIDFLISTSSIESINDKRHLRNAIQLDQLTEDIYQTKGKIGIVFGREDYGLSNEEISRCDIMLKIPTSEKYLSMNLSHAVAIVLYNIYIKTRKEKKNKKTLDKIEKEKLNTYFSKLLKEINYPEHKKENTEIMFKRIMGRAIPSKWEYHTMMGVFNKSIKKIKQSNNKKEK